MFRRRSDKCDAGFFAGAGKVCIFREEPVSRVNSVHFFLDCELDNLIDSKISAERSESAPHLVSFVRFVTVEREFVFFGKNRDGAEPEFSCGAAYADGDFAAVGYEYFENFRALPVSDIRKITK